MLMKLLLIILSLTIAAPATSFDLVTRLPPDLQPDRQQSRAAHLAANLLSRYHYQAMPLDEVLSEKIFEHYLKSLDAEKIFFVQQDIDLMAGIRSRLANAILTEDLRLPFVIFNSYTRRATERLTYARTLLKEGFDFKQNETYQSGREMAQWPISELEIRDLWRKRVKNDWLRLKLAGSDDKSIGETLDKRYDNSMKRIGRLTSKDAFEAFMNAYTKAIEPHTSYLGARTAEEFDIAMKLSLVGIGLTLVEKDGRTLVREVMPGSPSALSGQIQVGDRILGVAQGNTGSMVDILGWRMDDVVVLIRGAEDSVVLLDVLPENVSADGMHKLISLVRKKVTLEDQKARKTILSVTEANTTHNTPNNTPNNISHNTTHHIGVISLPTFYRDYQARQNGDRDFKSATRDVSRLLDELKQEQVDGVLIDLRNNGGGALTEAIELTGLFVGQGPVLQQRDAQGAISIERDPKAAVAWRGPLGVLINRGSASASEIFAAAIQDYGRGLVMGETSYGKGTVQSMINLDQLAKNDKPEFGELKLTIAQFFRITGDSTQLRGVTPDILFPAAAGAESHGEYGESSFANALPWLQIKAADYSPSGDLKALLPMLLMRHQARVMIDQDFKYLEDDIAESRRQRRTNRVSLNEAERRRERTGLEARLTSRNTPRNAGALVDDGLQADERNLGQELAAERTRKTAKDILLGEAVHVLNDEVDLLEPFANACPHSGGVCN